MVKKKDLEKAFIKKSEKVLKAICVVTGLIIGLMYGFTRGFESLLFGLRESKTVVGYCVVIIILLGLLVICNISETPENQSKKQREKSSYITVGIIITIVLFAILLIFTLLDFFLPIIVLVSFLILTYYLVSKIIEVLVNKYGIK